VIDMDGYGGLGHDRGDRRDPLEKLWHAVPTFPTTSEIWLNLLQEYGL
jgi:hypothetical protein